VKIIFQKNYGIGLVNIYQVYSSEDVAILWSELEGLASQHFFTSWFWLGPWLDLVLPEASVYLCCYLCESQIKAACFFTQCEVKRKKGLIKIKQLEMNEYAKGFNIFNGYGGILSLPEYQSTAWNCFIDAAKEFDSDWDEFLISSLNSSQYQDCIASTGNMKWLIDKRCFVWSKNIENLLTQEALLESFKRKSRQQLRQTIKAFEELGEIKVECASSLDQARDFFNHMGEVHSKRWAAVGRRGSFANNIWQGFHKRLIDRYFDAGIIQLLKISAGDQLLGFLYGHFYKGKIYMHQTAFTQADDNKLRFGYASHFYAMLLNAQNGVTEYDLLPDFECSYKKFFTDPGEEIVWVALKRDRLKFKVERMIEKIMSVYRWIRSARKSNAD
jgi:Acetyltransferase (GNAT) domain